MKFRCDEIIVPATFTTALGQIQHYLILSCKSIQFRHQTLAYEKVNVVTGYHNLHRPWHPPLQLQKPLTLTMRDWNIRQFLTESSPLIGLKVRMTLSRKGYLPEEGIKGWMIIDNPLTFLLEELMVTLRRKVTFKQCGEGAQE